MNRIEIIENHVKKGVIVPCFDGIIIDEDCTIDAGTLIYPGTVITNGSKIGANCKIGPNSYIDNTVIQNDVIIKASYAADSTIGDGTKIGPFCNLRPNSSIGSNVKIGDFVEIKNSSIGDKTSISHLTYVGDSDVGEHVNFGCGTVTVNYDGKKKSRTEIGDNVFIGCNTNFIAPVKINSNSFIAAGSTITENVPSNALAIARERQVNKEDWVLKTQKP